MRTCGGRSGESRPRPSPRPARWAPCIDILKSGTRREELLFTEDDLKKIHLLRRALSGTKPVQAMEAMLEGRADTREEQLAAALG